MSENRRRLENRLTELTALPYITQLDLGKGKEQEWGKDKERDLNGEGRGRRVEEGMRRARDVLQSWLKRDRRNPSPVQLLMVMTLSWLDVTRRPFLQSLAT